MRKNTIINTFSQVAESRKINLRVPPILENDGASGRDHIFLRTLSVNVRCAGLSGCNFFLLFIGADSCTQRY